MGKIRTGLVGAAAVAGLVASMASPASAAVRGWSPDADLSGWDCSTESIPGFRATACMTSGLSGGQVVYRAVLRVQNTSPVAAVRLRAAVINIWAGPSPSKQVADDGCLDSSLSPNAAAVCWGTLKTHAQVCSVKPATRYVTAAGAVSVGTSRPTPTSPAFAVVC